MKPENEQVQPLCPVCGETHFEVVDVFSVRDLRAEYRRQQQIDVGREFPPNLTSFSLLQCDRCGLQFFDPLVAGSSDFYAQISSGPLYYFTDRWEYQEALPLLHPQAAVVDVGCGNGHFLSLLPQKNKLGLDFNPQAVAAATARGLQVRCGALGDLPDQSADAITLFQVLEHLTEPVALLKEALRVLRKYGLLIIAVPNNDGFLGAVIQEPLNAPPHHPLRWRPAPLSYLPRLLPMKLTCLRCESLSPHYLSMYRKTVITRAFSKCLGLKIPLMKLTPVTVFIRRLANVLVRLSLLASQKVPRKPVSGFSILAVYQKS
ncbi:MAG: class I SAM-dependent methyltransferase [Chloroflexi bacterium]|nr:class I SAM-dependent methyltransferase [Chloroflexota bacterium]